MLHLLVPARLKIVLLLVMVVWLMACSPPRGTEVLASPAARATTVASLTPVPSVTVAPTVVPTVTPTVAPTVTSSPEPVEVFVEEALPIRPSPTPKPLAPTATPLPLPWLPYDLMALMDGNIIRLNNELGQKQLILTAEEAALKSGMEAVESLPIVRFIVTPDERQLLVATQVDRWRMNIDAFNLEGEWLYNIGREVAPLINWAVAPDGGQVIFMLDESYEGGGAIIWRDLNASAANKEIGYCELDKGGIEHFGCRQISWSPDGRLVVGRDGQGLWQFEVAEARFSRLLDSYVPEPYRDDFEYFFLARPLWQTNQVWSPSGRYFRVWRNRIEGNGNQAIWDTVNNRLMDIPNSNEYDMVSVRYIWLPGDRLLVARTGVDAYWGTGEPSTIEVWVVDEATQALTLVKSAEVGMMAVYNPVYRPEGGIFFFGSDEATNKPRFYLIEDEDSLASRLWDITKPEQLRFSEGVWTAKGEAGLFVYTRDGRGAFVFLPETETWVDLSPFVDGEVADYVWLD
ncbi:MAG TPA: hypothetical protein VLL52_16895 [Anaerolineae bacterium]|nr:hypothetical protein [Anaerolineae bacterium]